MHDCISNWNLETFAIKGSLKEVKVVEKLFTGLNLHELKWFELSDTPLNVEDCIAVNSCLSRANLDYLELNNCNLTEKSCQVLFAGLDLCWFKTKDSINIDNNTLVSCTGLEYINNAVINSGFVLHFEDLGINMKSTKFKSTINFEDYKNKLILAQKRSMRENQRAIYIK